MADGSLGVPLLVRKGAAPCPQALESDREGCFEAEFEASYEQMARRALSCLAALAVVVGGLCTAVCMLLGRVGSVPYNEAWLFFFLSAPATWVGGSVGRRFLDLREQACFLVVTLKNIGSKWDRSLTDAVLWELRIKGTSSPRTEAVVEITDDDAAGEWQVVLRPLVNNIGFALRAGVHQRWAVAVTVEMQNPVICGRNNEPRRTETIEFRIRTATLAEFLASALHPETDARLSARQVHAGRALRTWLQVLLKRFTAQKPGQIEVYELQQEYKDYRHCWEQVRKDTCCSITERGLAHYTAQPWAVEAKREVEWTLLQGGKSRLTLFLSGQKGSGKTHFVEWLAGEFRAPVYYIDLSNPTLNDEILRGCVARNRMLHAPPVLVHIDEFQACVRAWLETQEHSRPKDGVTIQGLQTMLEGISTPCSKVVFIITSSQPLPRKESNQFTQAPMPVQLEVQGLLRRLHCIDIPSLDMDTAQTFLTQFLHSYVAHPPGENMRKTFARAWCNWEPEVGVPFDMFTKYLEQAVRNVYVADARPQEEKLTPTGAFVPADEVTFLQKVMAAASVRRFTAEYAGGTYEAKFLEWDKRAAACMPRAEERAEEPRSPAWVGWSGLHAGRGGSPNRGRTEEREPPRLLFHRGPLGGANDATSAH